MCDHHLQIGPPNGLQKSEAKMTRYTTRQFAGTRQSPKKSQLSGQQTLTRKNSPDEVRKFFP